MARIRVDVINGIVEIDASEEFLEAATEYALRLLDNAVVAGPDEDGNQASEESPAKEIANEAEVKSDKQAPRKRKKGGGKVKNWQHLPELLNEQQLLEIKSLFEGKAPKNQNEQVAVICHSLNKALNRVAFDGNEIHTVFRSMGLRTPSNLSGVLGNMATKGLGHSAEGKFRLDFAGNQLVEHDLPKKKSQDD